MRRLIPKLQMKKSKFGTTSKMVLVTTINFNETIEIGDPVSQAKIYEAQAADELIFLDLNARLEKRETMVEVIRRAAEEIFMPFTVGGGVNSIKDFRRLLVNGADKVSVNTTAVNNKDLILQASEIYGAQCVVVSIDYGRDLGGDYHVWTNGGKEKTNLNPVDWAIEAEKRGAGEILLTSIDRDGKRQGLDVHITQLVSKAVSIPVISSGGCGIAQHFIEGFKKGKADAISAGTYFSFKDENPMQTRSQLKNAGIPIRMHT
jgi:imidazole glycerol-phosphate synthase subunit HisF